MTDTDTMSTHVVHHEDHDQAPVMPQSRKALNLQLLAEMDACMETLGEDHAMRQAFHTAVKNTLLFDTSESKRRLLLGALQNFAAMTGLDPHNDPLLTRAMKYAEDEYIKPIKPKPGVATETIDAAPVVARRPGKRRR